MTITVENINLVYTAGDLSPVLFHTSSGDEVRAGDLVSFYPPVRDADPAQVFASSGFVEVGATGLRIACFDMVFYRWNYYDIELKREGSK